MGFVARAEPGIDPPQVAAGMRDVVMQIDSDQPVREVAAMEAVVSEALSSARFLTLLLSAVGGLAALLAAVGVSGVMQSLLFQVAPLDPWAYAAALILVGVLSLGACSLPAAWASRLEPAQVLRRE